MPATDIDRLSDLAHNASNLASMSHRLEDHKAAEEAHYRAFKAARAGGKEDRPSLGQTHLHAAARHSKIAGEPESYAQKNVLACAADRDADRSPTIATHRRAADAHDAAAEAWRKENPAKKVGNAAPGEDPWELRHHVMAAKRLREQADLLEKMGGESEGGGGDSRMDPTSAAPRPA